VRKGAFEEPEALCTRARVQFYCQIPVRKGAFEEPEAPLATRRQSCAKTLEGPHQDLWRQARRQSGSEGAWRHL